MGVDVEFEIRKDCVLIALTFLESYAFWAGYPAYLKVAKNFVELFHGEMQETWAWIY